MRQARPTRDAGTAPGGVGAEAPHWDIDAGASSESSGGSEVTIGVGSLRKAYTPLHLTLACLQSLACWRPSPPLTIA